MAGLNEIRSTFLNYFEKNGHTLVGSSPLVPRDDPTLIFTNSGMVQFKNVFTGIEQRGYNRAATSQKCVRAGGKHNDLDNVGYTARHHTFFEMLGNFSFGDYFKEQAIHYCWDLVTREFAVDPKRLLATVYHDDEETVSYWKSIAGLSDDRIIRIATSDNFWSMGPVGPCGPCSELFFDYGDSVPGGPPGSADEDGDRFTEIWNLVFMQYEQREDGSRVALPKPSIDTGMGLERIGALLQGVSDNYRTDLFRLLIEAIANLTSKDPDGVENVHYRVIADHLRSSAFLLAEGVLPAKDGRGYVLRRIMRRAMRHAFLLGTTEPLLHRTVPELVAHMGAAFPELARAQPVIESALLDEEIRFRRTLGRGLSILDEALLELPEDAALPGEVAFKLYDTFGFPLDLTQDAVRESGREVEITAFEDAMQEQRRRARAAWSGTGDKAEDALWFELAEEFGSSEFLGYHSLDAEGQIQAMIQNRARIESAVAGQSVLIICNQTPFYAESGGQIGDRGLITTAAGTAKISATTRHAGLHVHHAVVETGRISVGDGARLAVDARSRQAIRMNHSATHLLHQALRQQLGDHVAQRGSLNDTERLRFDFSHGKGMELSELAAVEREVNSRIRANSAVETRIMTPEDAVKTGALALFGEKYGDEVRVVSMGGKRDSGKGPGGQSFSVELCGGTHVENTGEIGLFVAVGESATASGVRRIEALTGEAAFEYLSGHDHIIAGLSLMLKVPPAELATRIEALRTTNRNLETEVKRLRHELALEAGSGSAEIKLIKGIRVFRQELTDVDGRALPALIDGHKSRMETGIVMLTSVNQGKVVAAVGVTDDLTDRISAVDIIRRMTPVLGGSGGGGRPDLARGGGPDVAACADAIRSAEIYLEEV
ncbi:MAG: alanine--tRNA ligase [Rhodobacteraceae bacterium]|nr:alanine--tRNA ligase [Paracoccaceae bacterium]